MSFILFFLCCCWFLLVFLKISCPTAINSHVYNFLLIVCLDKHFITLELYSPLAVTSLLVFWMGWDKNMLTTCLTFQFLAVPHCWLLWTWAWHLFYHLHMPQVPFILFYKSFSYIFLSNIDSLHSQFQWLGSHFPSKKGVAPLVICEVDHCQPLNQSSTAVHLF